MRVSAFVAGVFERAIVGTMGTAAAVSDQDLDVPRMMQRLEELQQERERLDARLEALEHLVVLALERLEARA